MKVSDYITQKLGHFDIELSEADLMDITLNSSISLESDITQDNINEVKKAFADFIPSLLVRPTSVNESGFSVSWDIEGIKAYYSILCNQLGIENVFASKISDASDLW